MTASDLTINFSNLSSETYRAHSIYQDNGIIHLRNFLGQVALTNQLSELAQIEKIAEEERKKLWGEEKCVFYSRNAKLEPHIKEDFVTHPYFLTSADKMHIFYENYAGKLNTNRIGHGLHLYPDNQYLHNMVYKDLNLHLLLQIVGFIKPICHLSVYIPKYGNEIGSKVMPHQEATFVHTDPQSVVVLWIALEDATVENACLWGVLGSHRWPLKYVSEFNHKTKQRKFKELHTMRTPDFMENHDQFTPIETKAGDALIFHGNFIHCSEKNVSQRSRKALSLQFIETASTQYLNTNWIKSPNQYYLY